MRYALYIKSANKVGAGSTQNSGWYVGSIQKAGGTCFPICDLADGPKKRTKFYKSGSIAKIVGEAIVRKCAFVEGYSVEEVEP